MTGLKRLAFARTWQRTKGESPFSGTSHLPGDLVVIRLATTPALQADVRRAVSRSLELWWRFFDGIATAVAAC